MSHFHPPLCRKVVPGKIVSVPPEGTLQSPPTIYSPGPKVPVRSPLTVGWARTEFGKKQAGYQQRDEQMFCSYHCLLSIYYVKFSGRAFSPPIFQESVDPIRLSDRINTFILNCYFMRIILPVALNSPACIRIIYTPEVRLVASNSNSWRPACLQPSTNSATCLPDTS